MRCLLPPGFPIFSGEEPESLRGPQCELCVIDEIARMRYQQSVFDTMMLGLRLGDRPRVLTATTPRTTPFMKKLVAMDDVRITTGSTYDNAEHLSANFLKKVRELYEGTRLDRQELQKSLRSAARNCSNATSDLIMERAPNAIRAVTVVRTTSFRMRSPLCGGYRRPTARRGVWLAPERTLTMIIMPSRSWSAPPRML